MQLLISALITWLLVGLAKSLLQKKNFFACLLTTGGMPSAHSAIVSSVALSVWFAEGLSLLFSVAVVFGLIVVTDSMGVRRSVGEQGVLLNKLSKKELLQVRLGHTPREVLAGVFTGLLITLLVSLF